VSQASDGVVAMPLRGQRIHGRLNRAAPPRHAQPDRRSRAQRGEERRALGIGLGPLRNRWTQPVGAIRLRVRPFPRRGDQLPLRLGQRRGRVAVAGEDRLRRLPRQPQKPQDQRATLRAAAKRLATPQPAQNVVDMVPHRRPVLRTRHSARPAPTGSAPVRPAALRARRRARRSPPRHGRRASWDHFKNARATRSARMIIRAFAGDLHVMDMGFLQPRAR
jgi:hypothetical protein